MSRKRKEERSLLIQRGNDTENGDHEYLDETVSPRGSDINELDTEKRWRTVKIGEPTHIIEIGEGSPNLPETICVFPRGIHLILASNPNHFDVELRFFIPFHGDGSPVRVVIPSLGTVQGRDISPEPSKATPRSEDWCREYGVISKELLRQGIVEEREDGTMVVYRKFRHTPDRLTPFGLWTDRNPDVHSTSGLTIFTKKEYDELERLCCGTPCSELVVKAIPLLSRRAEDATTGEASVDIHLFCPAVLSSPGPPSTPPESNSNEDAVKKDAHLIKLDPDMYSTSTTSI